jgi:hypothetical protein
MKIFLCRAVRAEEVAFLKNGVGPIDYPCRKKIKLGLYLITYTKINYVKGICMGENIMKYF